MDDHCRARFAVAAIGNLSNALGGCIGKPQSRVIDLEQPWGMMWIAIGLTFVSIVRW